VAAYFGSYGWSGGAANQAKSLLQPGWELLGALEIKGKPTDNDLEAAAALGKTVAQRIKAGQ
jgi:flavorubredoxin